MKRIFALLLTFAVLFSFAGCQKEPAGETTGTTAPSSPTQTPTNPDPTNPTNPAQPDPTTPTEKPVDEITRDNWGYQEGCPADNGNSRLFSINFPTGGACSEPRGLVGGEVDGTMQIVMGEDEDSPDISNISEVFPAYFDQLQSILESFYGMRSSNWELTLNGNAPTKVGEYNMHTFTGTISFDYYQKGTTHYEYTFLAYATKMNSNGAYVCWVVYDISEDQSKGDLVAENALNMAKTFWEKE